MRNKNFSIAVHECQSAMREQSLERILFQMEKAQEQMYTCGCEKHYTVFVVKNEMYRAFLVYYMKQDIREITESKEFYESEEEQMSKLKRVVVVVLTLAIILAGNLTTALAASSGTYNFVNFKNSYIESASGTYRFVANEKKAQKTTSALVTISKVLDSDKDDKTSDWTKCKMVIMNGKNYKKAKSFSDVTYVYFGKNNATSINLYKNARAAGTDLYLHGIGNSKKYSAYITGEFLVY